MTSLTPYKPKWPYLLYPFSTNLWILSAITLLVILPIAMVKLESNSWKICSWMITAVIGKGNPINIDPWL